MSFVRDIVTRGYELDARMCVTPSWFARHFEYLRWKAIHEGASGLRETVTGGRRLVIRAQRITIVEPIGPHVPLSLTLSVAEVGSSSIRLTQAALREGRAIAINDVVGVALDADGRPTRVPDAVRMHATGAAEALPRLAPRPETPAYTCEVQVRPSDLDTLQHVNHARYVDFADDVLQHARASGVLGPNTKSRLAAITVEYHRETRLDPARGPASHLIAEVFPEGEHTFGVALLDPLDGALVARSTIVIAHEDPVAAGDDTEL